MKLREKFRRFWTMDVHNHEGFTLVELIIVIAILAILSSVAVVGYSSYVEKANKQADVTMIEEIKNVLTLAMYSDPFETMPAGVLVLSDSGITLNGHEITAGSELDIVLSDAFGSNYRTTLKLKYADWAVSSYINGMTVGEATTVKDSSYLSGNRADNLLTDVEMFTNMAANLAEAMGQVTGDTTLGTLFTTDLLNETALKYGITGPAEGETWDQWGAKPENKTAFSNLLVLATALDSQKMMDNATAETPDPDYAPAQSTDLILAFSAYYAFASTCPSFSTFLDGHMAKLDDVDSPSEGATWYSTLVNEAKKDTYKNADGLTYEQYAGSETAGTDTVAFAAIMASINKTTKEDLNGDLGNANLFTDGAVKGAYDEYMNAINAMAGGVDMDEELKLQKGQVAIIYNQGSLTVFDTLGE